jgi:hypothetical protein
MWNGYYKGRGEMRIGMKNFPVIPGLQACPVLDAGESSGFFVFFWIPAGACPSKI